MKLQLNWFEKYEVIREFPAFELDSNDFPELEMEMLQVYHAGSAPERVQALDALEYKMHQSQIDGGETIFEMFGPCDHDKFEQSKVYSISDEIGSFMLAEEEK
mgnify:CR=1 FL=1